MFSRLLTVVLLFGACFAAPQSSVDVSVSGSVVIPPAQLPSASDTQALPQLPDGVSLPNGVSLPADGTLPASGALPAVGSLPDVGSLPEGGIPPGGPPSLPNLIDQLNLLGCTQMADLLSRVPLSSLVPPGTQVTVPAIPDSILAPIVEKLKDAFGNFNLTKVADLLKSVILKDLHFKQQLAEAAVGTIKNLLNQTQNIRGYPDGACVWNGGNITLPNIPFDQGIIQKVSGFVPKVTATLGDLLKNVTGTLGTVLGTVLNTVKNILTFNYNEIFNNANSTGYTFIVPQLQTFLNWLKPENLRYLLNNIKSLIIPGNFSPQDLAHMTSVTNMLGQRLPISFSSTSTHVFTVGDHTFIIDSSFASGSGGNVLTAS